jgi:uncharacterized lipoprotein NlpE involved in copper resistance
MKKITCLFIASLLTSLFLLGCGSKESSTPESMDKATVEKAAAANESEAEKMAAEAEKKAKEMAAKAEAEAKKAMEELQKKK